MPKSRRPPFRHLPNPLAGRESATMLEIHEGGCVCGSVRYRAQGRPERVSVCHCTHCQRRTGSAFALVAHFKAASLTITGGPLSAYEYRSDESDRWIRLEFCPRCGTAITLTAEQSPGRRTVAGGTCACRGTVPRST